MKKILTALICSCFIITSSCQTETTASKFNLDFEKTDKGRPTGWSDFGNSGYKISLDSTHVKNGKYSAKIEFNGGRPDYKAWELILPHNYEGKKITLTGYIKTEEVSDGYAGLWMRIDPSIAFENMRNSGIQGTTDWQRVDISLTMKPDQTEHIVIGGLLVGKGKMWLDDLSISVDGKDIQDLKPYVKKEFPADLDNEFDKGSRIANLNTDQETVGNLNVLGLVWGFIKYYHPNVAKGTYNWDYELFRVLPKVLASQNSYERDAILVKWINVLGAFEVGKETPVAVGEVKIKPDLGWIESSGLSNELISVLHKVKNAQRAGEHYYIGLYPGVGNPVFKNEKPYSSMELPDAGYRLLSLFRYWNIIQYYFPYKNLIEEDWKGVLKKFIPSFISAKTEEQYTLTVLELIGRVHDTHANVWGRNKVLENFRGLNVSAVELTFVENKAVVTGYYDDSLGRETGLKVGDIVTKINRNTVESIVKDRLKLTPASNYPTQLRDIGPNLLRSNDTTIHIEYYRNGRRDSTVVQAYSDKAYDLYRKFMYKDSCFKVISPGIGYINNGALKSSYLQNLWSEILKTKGLIIDIRNYPSDFVIYGLSSYLMPQRSPFVKFTIGSIEHPGLFTFKNTLHAGGGNDQHYKGKVVILVNELTQSSAEFHAMAYRTHPNAVVIGSTTAGADGNVSEFTLPGGIQTMISGIGVYYPDGRETQRVGIVPDIEVKPTIEGVKNGRDELLERAVKIIKGQSVSNQWGKRETFPYLLQPTW